MIHEQAYVHPSVKLGDQTHVWQFASVMMDAVLGDGCVVGPCGFVGVGAILGQNVRIQHGAHITDHAIIGNNVFIGNGVMMGNDKHPIVNNPTFKRLVPVIEDDVSVGMGAVILPGVTLGQGCVIGAGAVVTRSVDPFTTVVGNPARPVRRKK